MKRAAPVSSPNLGRATLIKHGALVLLVFQMVLVVLLLRYSRVPSKGRDKGNAEGGGGGGVNDDDRR